MSEGEELDIPDLPPVLNLYMRLPPSLHMTIRFGLSTAVGIFVTLFLFYVMQALIQSSEKVLKEDELGNLVDFVRVKQETKLERRQRKLKKPPPPDEPPPNLPPQNFNVSIDNTGFSMQQPLWRISYACYFKEDLKIALFVDKITVSVKSEKILQSVVLLCSHA